MSKNKIALGALFGAVTGFVAGILAAPKSGKETREDIKDAALKAKDAITDETEKVKDAATEKAQEVKAKAEEVVGDMSDRATDLKERTEHAIEAAKKGFAKDPRSSKK